MSVLLTGGAGFIGSHTAVELLNAGEEIIIADNFSNSSSAVLLGIESIAKKASQFYNIDVADCAALSRIFEAKQITAVIHFAGYKAVGESVQNPIAYYRNNLDTTLSLLEVMHEYGIKQLIFSSSATVYGMNNTAPFTEDMPTGGCTNPYGWTKYMIEQILLDAAKADPTLSVVLLRYFNPIGAHESGQIGENPNGIPNNLMPYITQVAAGILPKLSVYGTDYQTHDGTGVRDYIHVMDLAAGHAAALNYAKYHTGAEMINLGTGIGYSVLDVIHAFEEATGIKIPYEPAPRRPGDIAACYAGTQKAKSLLGWEATRNIVDMCRDSWRWQQHCVQNSK